MRDYKVIAFWLSLAFYLAALPIGWLLNDAAIVRALFVVVFTASYAFGLRAGLLVILISLPVHGVIYIAFYNDWTAFLWTFNPLPRAVQLLLAITIGRFKEIYEQLSDAERDLRERTAQLEHALAQVRELRGIICICATCKNIRDDDDRWIPMESYITDRSHALFSHCMCPSCYEREMSRLRSNKAVMT